MASDIIWEEDEEDIGTLEESLISFSLSGPNEELSWEDQQNEELTSNEDSIVRSPLKKPRRWFMRKEKGKIKMLEYGTDKCTSDPGESDANQSKGEPQELRLDAAKRAIKSTN